MTDKVFRIEDKRPVRNGMTISRNAGLSKVIPVTYFSLGKGTSISQESYDEAALYIGAQGSGTFLIGEEKQRAVLEAGKLLVIPQGTLCGIEADEGFIYTEIIPGKEINMNAEVKAKEAFLLKDLISYEEGSIANMDIVSNGTMKYVLMAFDEGTGLPAHRAPGDAIVFALEGKAIIGYEGEDYELEAGECFRFEKNGLHSVTAQGRFKMALLLVVA